MILALFCVLEDSRVWAQWNYSFEMHLNYLGQHPAFLPPESPPGAPCRVGAEALGAMAWWWATFVVSWSGRQYFLGPQALALSWDSPLTFHPVSIPIPCFHVVAPQLQPPGRDTVGLHTAPWRRLTYICPPLPSRHLLSTRSLALSSQTQWRFPCLPKHKLLGLKKKMVLTVLLQSLRPSQSSLS